jgi:hypothetical protein
MSTDEARNASIVTVENACLRLTVRKDDGAYAIHHKQSGRTWHGPAGRFCSATLVPNDDRPHSGYDADVAKLAVNRFEYVRADTSTISLLYVPAGIATARTNCRIEFRMALLGDADLELSYRVVEDDPDWLLSSVDIIDDALALTDPDGYAVLPVYQGEMVPVGGLFSYLPKDRQPVLRTSAVAGTYPGVGQWNMAMLALVATDSTLVVTWDDPDIEAGICGRQTDAATGRAQVMHTIDDKIADRRGADGGRQITSTVTLNREARSIRLHFMQDAGYVEVADYYRGVAAQRGLMLTLSEKIQRTPELVKNLGALRFTVAPMWGRSEGAGWLDTIPKGSTRCDYTFAEVADVAEHLKHNVGIDKALALVKGWTRRGYDMDYPDVLPAAEPCGGNLGLADAARRTQALGWLFGLHDNALILFKECPSTDPADALVRQDGTCVEGSIGVPRWSLYCCCPARMFKYVEQHYQIFKEEFQLNYMYSDQIAAMPLPECFSSDHPLTRRESIASYAKLIAYKKSQVAIIASELMDEWAVPIFDVMGAFMGNAHDYARPIPLFELVYGECCNFDGWAWGSLMVDTIVNCISMGRMPYLTYPQRDYLAQGLHVEDDTSVYYAGGGRLRWDCWWLQGYHPDNPFLRGDQGWGEETNWYDRFVRNVYEVTSPLNELTALQRMVSHEFLAPDRQVEKVTFADGTSIVTNRSDSDFEYQGTLLPPHGFVAVAPMFVTFYAKRHAGVAYPEGALFAIRACDGKPLSQSRQVRVYHGFGQISVKIGQRVFEVQREQVLDPQS